VPNFSFKYWTSFLTRISLKGLNILGWINWLLLNFVKLNVMMKLIWKKSNIFICTSNGKNIYWLLFVHYYQMSIWADNVVRMSTLKRNESYMVCYGFLYTKIISPYYRSEWEKYTSVKLYLVLSYTVLI
jgi:hypothetical protein